MQKSNKILFILIVILTQNLQASQINYSNSVNSESIGNLLAIINKITKENLKTNTNINLKDNITKIINSNIEYLFGQQIIDGIKLFAKDQVLLSGQINKKENGLWVVQDAHWHRPENKNSIDLDLEFISPNEQNDITKAGGGNVTVQNFSSADLIVKTDGSTLGVTGSGITLDSSNNLSGVNTISATGISLPTTSISNPTIKFPGTNTGIYSDSQDQISISSQGANIIAFGSTGTTIPSNLAIGSSTLFNNTATFANTATFNSTGTTNITGQLNITGTANFNGATNTLNGRLNLNGTTNITGTTLINPANINGVTTFSGTTNIAGQTTISSPSTISNINLSGGGSQTSPAITFNSDTSSGIYSPAIKNISISTAGTQKINIYATGINATGTSISGDINMNNQNITDIGTLSLTTLNTSTAVNTAGININGALNATETTSLNGTLTATGGSTNIYGGLNVTLTTNFNGGLTTAGTVNLNGPINSTGIFMTGDITMNGKNITGANKINATAAYLQPGTTDAPSLTFNGNTGIGLCYTSGNTINFCGGPSGVNAKISPSGLSMLNGSFNLSSQAIMASGSTMNLDSNIAIYQLSAPGDVYFATGTSNNPIGKLVTFLSTALTGSNPFITSTGNLFYNNAHIGFNTRGSLSIIFTGQSNGKWAILKD